MDATTLCDRVSDHIIGNDVPITAVNGDIVGQYGDLNRVIGHGVIMIGPVLSPQSDAIVTEITKVTLLDGDMADTHVEVNSISGSITDTTPRDGQAIEGTFKHHTDFVMFDPDIGDR